jgi:PmbA protein
MQISERPHLTRALASGYFDERRRRDADREVVQDGVLQGYFLSTYTARKLACRPPATPVAATTLSSSRARAICRHAQENGARPAGDRTARPWRQLRDRRLFARRRRLLGRGRRDRHPVEEITIAGNLRDMFRNIAGVGNDVLVRGSKQVGSLLIEQMKVAGA